jgi:hypothetical protein
VYFATGLSQVATETIKAVSAPVIDEKEIARVAEIER